MSTIINDPTNINYYVTPTGVSVSGRIKSYSTIAERNAESSPPTYAVVLDATADPTVHVGSAMYAYKNGTWVKIYEVESMDWDEKFTWENIIGGPDVPAEDIVSAVNNQHTHNNLNVLSRLSTDNNNSLTFDGISVSDTTSNAARLDTIEPIVASSSAKLLTIDAAIQSIQDEMVTEVPVTSVNDRTGDIVITLDDIDTSSITDRLDTIEPIVTVHTTSITVLDAKLTTQEAAITELQNKESVAGVSTVNGLAGDVTLTIASLGGATQDSVDANTTAITEITGTVALNTNNIAGLAITTATQAEQLQTIMDSLVWREIE